MRAPRAISTLAVSIAAAGALLLSGCGSSSTASLPSVATSASEASSESAAPTSPISSAPAEVSAERVVAKWTCERGEGKEVTCTCEGSEADCKSSVAKPSTLKGMKEKGTVKWFNDGKGYGFIAANRLEGEVDVFVHFSAIDMDGLKTLNSGQCVEFEVKPGPKGLQAEGVRSC